MKALKSLSKSESILQLLKYGIVGVVNTAITAIVIFLLLQIFHTSDFVANISGYTAGLVNSFLMNRKWTFAAKGNTWVRDAVIFFLGFVLCYLLQYWLVDYLNRHTGYAHIYNHYIGMVFYTGLNFLYNKFVTFKK